MATADHLSSESDNNPPTDFNLEAAAGLKIGFSLALSLLNKDNNAATTITSSKLVFEELDNNSNKKIDKASGGNSALEELMREEEKVKEKLNRKDYWLREGIIVKVMSKPLAYKGYYKHKGVVKKVIDKYVGEIQMLDNKHVLRLIRMSWRLSFHKLVV
ncbi:hypothetical protein LWI28_005160 [Acer negundo]|uniref:KN17 SH3-like domain-containing protein n=1 Tax=Acer negundo TaxID=4023 RepID=A0AAD5ILF5_ACENE|nr:hypothetical protein LWI28_005160 [Acer negundo]